MCPFPIYRMNGIDKQPSFWDRVQHLCEDHTLESVASLGVIEFPCSPDAGPVDQGMLAKLFLCNVHQAIESNAKDVVSLVRFEIDAWNARVLFSDINSGKIDGTGLPWRVAEALIQALGTVAADDRAGVELAVKLPWRSDSRILLIRREPHGISMLVSNSKGELKPPEQEEAPPLWLAAAKGQLEIVKELIAAGADVNAGVTEVGAPLHVAVLRGQKDVVEVLLTNGANKDAIDHSGKTPLDIALKKGHKELIELLQHP